MKNILNGNNLMGLDFGIDGYFFVGTPKIPKILSRTRAIVESTVFSAKSTTLSIGAGVKDRIALKIGDKQSPIRVFLCIGVD